MKKVLFVTATDIESEAIRGLSLPGKDYSADFLVTGPGLAACSYRLTKYLSSNPHPVLAVNAGIAGSYNDRYLPGTAGIVVKDCFADFGIDDRGMFVPATLAGLAGQPFNRDGWIVNNAAASFRGSELNIFTGVTSDNVTGSAGRIKLIRNRFNPDIESMEGAVFFYICELEKIPYAGVRSVSNMVRVRDRSNWEISLALRILREATEKFLTLYFTKT